MLHLHPRQDCKRVTDEERMAMTRELYTDSRLNRSLRFSFCFALMLQTGKRKMVITDVCLNHMKLLPVPECIQGDAQVS